MTSKNKLLFSIFMFYLGRIKDKDTIFSIFENTFDTFILTKHFFSKLIFYFYADSLKKYR